ncbi:MAG: trypsin-like peptidase domain-containing protein [Cytophagales bacterium]|nr:trypsin-like peptidase domain-containing protein [Bernardetiaceae bacterium]MDW8203704.1 trypsin-like peptidase domain-containing protein [Cytophagales bacterium]
MIAISKRWFLGAILLSAIIGGSFSLGSYLLFFQPTPMPQPVLGTVGSVAKFTSAFERLTQNFTVPEGLNFLLAAERSTPSVVHIRTQYRGDGIAIINFFDDNDENMRRGMSTGSGVIISEDGLILTNHHVIDEADQITVTLDDKRQFTATVIGQDPTTDLALIKIQADNLIPITYGNSDEVKIGEWVLAVGNPFDLTSTVTAGIISGKARNINLLFSKDGLAIESFLQTDAAVNPGNSGGALVNLKGELIGINTAIATRTGAYAGYSFAIPVNLAKKVAEDLYRYGHVQRALLGVSISEVTDELARKHNLTAIRGIYVSEVNQGSGAADAGIKPGDIILSVDGKEMNTVANLQELIARHRPGDRVEVIVERQGEQKKFRVTLKNRRNNTSIVSAHLQVPQWNAEIEELSSEERKRLKLENGGLRIVRLGDGVLKANRIPEGFIITHIDKKAIRSITELQRFLAKRRNKFLLEGINKEGERAFFGIGF